MAGDWPRCTTATPHFKEEMKRDSKILNLRKFK